MPGATYNIKIVLASTGVREAGADFGHAGDQARGAGKNLDDASQSAQGAGKSFVSLGGLVKEAAANFAGYLSAQAVFQGLTKLVSFAKDTILGFDDAMTQSLAIMGNVSAETRKSMEGTAREVALKYNAAVEDVAQSYYFLASAGYDAATSQKALGQVTAFAKAGMFDMEKATEMAADAQNAMGLKSDDANQNLVQLTRITDVLTKANIDANGSVEQFGDALTNKAAAGARLAGVSLESTVAVLETFAAQGLKGKKAGEAFSIVLRDLQEKSRTNSDAFEALGVTVYDAQGAFAGFPTIISQLENALKGQTVEQMNATLATLGFTVEGANYIKTLLGMSGAIVKYEDGLKSATGLTQQIAEKQMQSLIEQMKHLRAVAAELSLVGFE
jgi:TP901 family phage tail tape measure protein